MDHRQGKRRRGGGRERLASRPAAKPADDGRHPDHLARLGMGPGPEHEPLGAAQPVLHGMEDPVEGPQEIG